MVNYDVTIALRVIAKQLASGEISETHAYNHVADLIRTAVDFIPEEHFKTYLKELGGARKPPPVPMRLPCPGTVPDGHGGLRMCGVLHIDEGRFATHPHHTHSCQTCGMTWRPAVVATVGVQFLPGFKNE